MRCNVGVNPKILTDQWLVAEYRELPMVVGSLRINNWQIKSVLIDKFNLGKGYLNFFKNRLAYLKRRHEEVKKEMARRNFKCDKADIVLDDNTQIFWNDWIPSKEDSNILRQRLIQKLVSNENGTPFTWWRYMGISFKDDELMTYIEIINKSELYFV